MATLASLNVFLGLNSATFRRGLEASQKDFKTFTKNATQGAKVVASTVAKVGAAATATATVIAYASNRTINSLVEMRREASNVGVAVEKWQEYAYAAKNAGLESDNLKDVIKDLNAKITDAALTGGGAMIDFFQRTNQSAAEWAQLDPASQFEQFVTEINKLPESEARFFLDEVNDSAAEMFDTLVTSKGEFFNNAKEARQLGLVLSSEVLDSVKSSQEQITKLSSQLGAMWDSTVAAAAPAITEITKGIKDWINETATARGGFFNLGKTIAVSTVEGVVVSIQAVESLAQFTEGVVLRLQKLSKTGIFSGLSDSNREKLIKARELWIDINDAYEKQSNHVNGLNKGTSQYFEELSKLGNLGSQLSALEGYFDSVGYSGVTSFAGIINSLKEAQEKIKQFKDDFETANKAVKESSSVTTKAVADDWKFLTDHIKEQTINWENVTTNAYDNIQGQLSNNISTAIVEHQSLSEAMKASFKSATTSIIADIIKMGIQRVTTHLFATTAEETINTGAKAKRIAESVAESAVITSTMTPAASVTSLATGGTNAIGATIAVSAFMAFILSKIAGAREKGGYTRGGLPYLVGERGPELFVPGASGQITNNDNLKKVIGSESSNDAVTVTNNYYGIGDSMENVTKFSRKNANKIKHNLRPV
ncbi:hypothetical protein Q4575_05335 [Psychrosphaera sp. 1_MG-2023]|uniref:hypothetical protein n=1 Tax=Psychrosphaera sp. 1_MG-2023 TaxID=3062643 RepID=UPI0026E14D9B|nr:hypothetical protein [Psychrosphaera sp. 1_MG-2023]MDO6718813.1 hypothetical protein [Psychrosphaera sp. 1_MG-2023]